jgi:hypothetical protein
MMGVGVDNKTQLAVHTNWVGMNNADEAAVLGKPVYSYSLGL